MRDVLLTGVQTCALPIYELPSADGRDAMFVAADVREPEQVDEVVGAAVERFSHLDVLVNNAGGSPPAEAARRSEERRVGKGWSELGGEGDGHEDESGGPE